MNYNWKRKFSDGKQNLRISLSNRLKDMEKRISCLKDKAEEMTRSVKENVKAKNIQAQHFQKIWDAIKRPNLHIILIEEVEEVQVKGRKSIFNKIIRENFSKFKERDTYQGTGSIQNTK